jgi:hypothetical protein
MLGRHQRAARLQRPRQRTQQRRLVGGDDAEYAQPVVAALGDAFIRRSGQHLLDMAVAEALPGAVDR